MSQELPPPAEPADDESFSRRKREPLDAESDITPMIDMTFLLLIFFVVCSKMDAASGPPLPAARYGVATPSKNAVIITIAKGTGEDGAGVIYKGNGMSPDWQLKATDPVEQEQELAAYVEEEAASGIPTRDSVLIKAGRGIKHKEVAKVTKAVAKVAEVNQLFIAVEETND